jgi:hypothetical protein
MELPGGVLHDGRLLRDYRFQPVTGELERAIADSGFGMQGLPHQVTRILSACLAEVAGRAVDADLVRALSAGDRQFLMLQLEALLNPLPRWVTASCRGCGELIQFQIQPGSLPVKPAGAGYPQTSLDLSVGRVLLRVPCGADEEAITEGPVEVLPLQRLLGRLLSLNDRPVEPACLSESDLERIDERLDEMSPQPGLIARIDCPYCRLGQEIAIDADAWIASDGYQLDREVHTLALHYHWSEQEILQLSRRRRERYLQLIDQSLGKYRADDLIRGVPGGVW